mgnify:FL=1|tara:strand:- start:18252 stop:21539 length:3288 start_codon:yes stop_codon:yes gene_type:complete
MTRLARWFLDIELDTETLRWWSGRGPITFDGYTYTGLGTRWKTPDSLKRSASLKSEKLELEFDSGRQTDNSDPIGALLDKKWHLRPVRLRRVAWDAGDLPDDGDLLEDERGRIQNLPDVLQSGKPATLTMEIESGVLKYLERRNEKRTPAGQKAVFPDDLGFDLITQLQGATLIWNDKHKKVGRAQIELQDEYKPEPRKFALGRFVNSGSFVAAFTNGLHRGHLQRIYAIADHRINKLDRLWINGNLVRSSPLIPGVRTLVRLDGDKGENRCWVTFYDGRVDQEADVYLVSEEPSWTVNHRLRGVAYVIVEHWWDSDLPESFDYRFGGEGALLYDRRKDSTAGGFGAHRWDDPDTWEYNANAMVATDHYRSGIRIMAGSSAMWFGVGEASDAVPYSELEFLADHCDDDIPLKAGSTQKRYEVNGVLSADESHDKNLQKLADQMAARAIDQGGRLAIRPPIARTPVITLTDDDLVRGSESKIDPGALIDDMVNTIEGQFVNPEADYKKDDFPKVQVAGYVEDDGGEITDSRDLELENSGERAQRIVKLEIEASRGILQLTETYRSPARVIVPGEWYNRASAMRGFPGGKLFVADKVNRYVDGSVEVTGTEVYPDGLVWNAETAKPITSAPAFPDVSRVPLPPPVIVVTPISLEGGGASTTAVRFTHAAYTTFLGDQIEVELAYSDGGDPAGPIGDSTLTFIPGKREEVQAFIGIPPSTEWVVRFRARLGEREGDWSGWQVFTSLDSFSIGLIAGRTPEEVVADIDRNALDVATDLLSQAAWRTSQEALMYIGGDTVGTFATELSEIVDDNVLSLSVLGSRNGSNTAWILNGATVINGSGGASAKSLLAMRTEHDNNISDITELFETVDGQLARWAINLNVNGHIVGVEAVNSGVPATSSFIIVAPNFALVDPGNGITAPFIPFAVSGGTVRMYSVEVDTIKANSIETDNLKDNSVSNTVIVYQAPGVTLSSSATSEAVSPPDGTGFSDIFDHDYTHQGGNLKINLAFMNFLDGGSYCAVFTQLLIDGVVKESRYHIRQPLFGSVQEWTFGLTGIAAGVRNIRFRCRANRASSGTGGTGGDNVSISWAKAIIGEKKK